MAVGTRKFFPGLIDVHRMDKFQGLVDGSSPVVIRPALTQYGVAQITIPGDGFTGITFMVAIMAPEAAVEFDMANLIGIVVPGNIHFGKNIGGKASLHSLHGLGDHSWFLGGHLRIIGIVKCMNLLVDDHVPGISGGEGIIEDLHGQRFDLG